MDYNVGGYFTKWVDPFFNDYLQKNDHKKINEHKIGEVPHNISQSGFPSDKFTEDFGSPPPDTIDLKTTSFNKKRVKKRMYPVQDYAQNIKTDENIDLSNSSLKKSFDNKVEFTTSNPKQINKRPSISLKKEVIVRVAHLGAGIISFMANGLDVAIAGFPAIFVLGNAILSNITWKKIPFSNNAFFQTQKFLRGSATILPRCYEHALKVLSPRAKFPGKSFSLKTHTNLKKDSVLFPKDGNGLLTDTVIKKEQYEANEPELHKLQRTANECINSKKFFARQVMSRVNYLGLAVLLTLTRTFDALVGVIAAPLSFLAVIVGGSATLNNLAYRGLQAPAIINDLFYCTVKIIDPFAGTDYDPSQDIGSQVPTRVKEISCSSYLNSGEKNDYKINI